MSLKKCPFCDKEVRISEERRGLYKIRCCYCGLELWKVGKKAVIKIWNNRPIDDALGQALENAKESIIQLYQCNYDDMENPVTDWTDEIDQALAQWKGQEW